MDEKKITELIWSAREEFLRTKNGETPDTLIIHKSDFYKFTREINYNEIFNHNGKLVPYLDLKIIRTVDIEEGCVKVY